MRRALLRTVKRALTETPQLIIGVALVACSPLEGSFVSLDAGPPQPSGGTGAVMGSGEWMHTDDPAPEPTEGDLSTTLLLRVMPISYLNDDSVNYVYCSVVPLSESILVAPAECVRRGVSYGEVFQGERVDFSTRPSPVARVKTVFTHPQYEALTSTDLALIHVDPPLRSRFATFAQLSSARVSAFIRVGYVKLEGEVFERRSKVAPVTSLFESELLFGLGASESCRLAGGGVLYPIDEQKTGVVAINSRGGDDCIDYGVAVRLDASRDFLLSGSNSSVLPSGHSGDVRPTLTCGQTTSPHCSVDVDCQAQLAPSHRELRDELFNCAISNAPCDAGSCYGQGMPCHEAFLNCLSGPPIPDPLMPSPSAGAEAGSQAGGEAGAEAGQTAGAGVMVLGGASAAEAGAVAGEPMTGGM